MYTDRNYVIFNVSELHLIDFSQVLESSSETVRKSADGTKTFIKWNDEIPTCISALTTKGEFLTHTEMLEMLNSPEWINSTEKN